MILKNDFGYTTLAECDFDWELGKTYQVEVCCSGSQISLTVDGQRLLEVTDDAYDHGMFGCGSREMGRTAFGNFTYQDL